MRLIGFQSLLERVPDFQVAATSIAEIASDQSLDVALLGNHSGRKFFETMTTLKIVRPELRVVVTGSGMDEEAILKSVACGAKGYVDEAAPSPDFAQAICAVHHGSVWLPRRVMSKFIERSGDLLGRYAQAGCSTLTSREKQVLRMLVEGRSNREIGDPLGIVERTVKAHVAKLMRKFGVKNRIALSVHAVHNSLVAAQ